MGKVETVTSFGVKGSRCLVGNRRMTVGTIIEVYTQTTTLNPRPSGWELIYRLPGGSIPTVPTKHKVVRSTQEVGKETAAIIFKTWKSWNAP